MSNQFQNLMIENRSSINFYHEGTLQYQVFDMRPFSVQYMQK